MSVLPAYAWAATSGASKSTSSTPTELEFTLPTAGMSGCQVCHADPNLVKSSATATTSIFVDPELMAAGPHATTPCTGCHVDFAYKTPHDNVAKGDEWRQIAKIACKNCHKDAYAAMNKGAHSAVVRPGETLPVADTKDGQATPLCGDCHGSHDIVTAEEMTSSPEFHNSGLEMCGQCHEEETANYRDYYHGAAYQEGASDSPACWDCHSAHEVLPADNRLSTVSEAGLEETCAQAGCHDDVNDDFLAYSTLVHQRKEAYEELPGWSVYQSTAQAIGQAVDSVKSVFGR